MYELQLQLFKDNSLSVFGVELKGATLEDCRKELQEAIKGRSDIRADGVDTRKSDGIKAPSTFDEESRTVETVVASETPVIRFDWTEWEYYNETLPMDAVDLKRASNGIPLLNSHDHWDAMKSILGTTSDLRVEGDKLVGVRHFSTTAEKAFTLAKEGHLRGQSVGYRVSQSKWLKPGESAKLFGREFKNEDKNLRLRVATKWEPVEDSIVIFPADTTTGMRSADGAGNTFASNDAGDGTSGVAANKQEPQQRKEQNMPEEDINKNTPPAATATGAPDAATVEEGKKAATVAERARNREITDMCKRFDISDEIRDKLIDGGSTVDEARKAVMDEIEKRSKQNNPPPAGHVTQQRDYIDQVLEPLTDALCVRGEVNIPKDKLHKDHTRFLSASMRDICLEILAQRGESIDRLTARPDEIFSRAIATGDLPILLKNTANRSLMAGWDYQDETYDQWCGTASTGDLREQTVARGLMNFKLDEVKEGQDYTYADMSEESLSYRIAKYGKMIAFTEEAFINDDLSQLTEYPQEMGRASRALEAELAYNYLINNPNFADGTALFHASHGNLAGSGAKPTEASVSAALLAMSIQKDSNGKLIRVVPQVGVFPATWRATAETLFGTPVWDDGNAAATRKNIVANVLGKRVYEPRLDDAFSGSNLPWFLIGPAAKGVRIVHLRGYETPTLTTEKSFNIDGFRAKIRHFCGSYVASYQALYKNPGTTAA